MDQGISSSVRFNTRISKLMVSCPNITCRSRINLSEYETHLRLCNEGSKTCPYIPLGCDNKEATQHSLLTHLHGNVLPHTELLMNWIHNLKNEIKELKECSKLKEIKMDQLINRIEKQESYIEELKEKFKFKEILERKVNEVENCVNNINQNFVIRETEIADMDLNFKEMINGIAIKICTINDTLEERKIQADLQRNDIATLRMNYDLDRNDMSTTLIDLKTSYNQLEEKMRISDAEKVIQMKNLIKWNRLCNNAKTDFVWKITECSKKLESKQNYFSKPFYCFDYKLCLQVIIKNDKVGLLFNIMKGDNDDKIQWPMKRSVTLAILNQESMNVYSEETFNYNNYTSKSGFEKPTTNRNLYIGNLEFIFYSKIKSLPSVLFDDSFFVSCGMS